MLDANKYAQYFPDESHQFATPGAARVPAQGVTASLLAALAQLEKEFKEILRAQQAEPIDPPE